MISLYPFMQRREGLLNNPAECSIPIQYISMTFMKVESFQNYNPF
jgi:hypothetical protein